MNKKNFNFDTVKSEMLLTQFWDISVDGMRITDEKGITLSVNKAFCRIVGMEKQKLENKLFPIIYAEDERENALHIYKRDLKNNKIKTHFEAKRTLWNGKTVWFEFSNSFIDIPGFGKIVLSVINDITNRKSAEFKLIESEKRFKMLFNNANDSVFVILLDGDNRLSRFIEVNETACHRFDCSHEELLHINPYSIFPVRFYGELPGIINTLIDVKHVVFESDLLTRRNRSVPFEISAHLINLNGNKVILSIARDITERKNAEQKLKNSKEQLRNLASHLQTIREEERTLIAREIHDELGQMLTVLKIQTSLLATKLQENCSNLTSRTDYILSLIDHTVESVQKITSKLRPGILDELGLIAAIEWQIEEFQHNSGIQFEKSLPKQEVQLEDEKATAVFRIFQEALTNAMRHADPKKISVQMKTANNFLLLEITDNGLGINPSQIHSPKSFGIMGMKERALLFGGHVNIYGVPEKGTNVKVEIPL